MKRGVCGSSWAFAAAVGDRAAVPVAVVAVGRGVRVRPHHVDLADDPALRVEAQRAGVAARVGEHGLRGAVRVAGLVVQPVLLGEEAAVAVVGVGEAQAAVGVGERGDVAARSVVAVLPLVRVGVLSGAVAQLVHHRCEAAGGVVAVGGAATAGVDEVHQALADVRAEIDDLEVAREDLQLAREDGAGAGVGPKADVAAAGVQAGDVHAVAVAALAHGGRGGTTRDKVHVVVAGEQLHRVRPEGPDRVFGPIAARTAAGGRRPRSAARSTRPFPTPSAATSQSSARTGSGSRTSRTSEPTKAASTSPRSNSSPPAIPSQKCPSLAINWSMVRPREFGSSSSRNPVSAISAASASRSRSRVSIVNGVWPSVSTIANAGRSRRVMTSRSSSNSAGESFFIALRRPPAG